MPIIKDGKIIDGDDWRILEDSEPIPAGHPVIVSYERWSTANGDLSSHNAPLGLSLRADQPPGLIADNVGRFDLIALEFPALADGRTFSHARLLRRRLRFSGELRATGHVFQDQMFFMKRCGFDSFDLPGDRDPDGALAALDDFSVAYQTG
ncbi:MAG: DUF934 domain-containing protein, partial [Rhodospirillales bacterium]|nr:DUF934 domain-containing protein [Rhodospirillales bacterium]